MRNELLAGAAIFEDCAMTVVFEKQTLALVYAQLASSAEVDRTALGDFVDDFFKYYVGERQSLLDDPIQMPVHPTEDQRGWAAFCAGAAEYLSERYHLNCPAWAHDLVYFLPQPWYHPAARIYPKLRPYFEQHVPEPFRRHNVFCSDRIFTNPYASSQEPGTLADVGNRRREILDQLSSEERETYLAARVLKMAGKPRVHIVV
jgi:hypothetical protein